MNVETLEHFLYLAEYKSISKTAKNAFLSRQALTDAMNKLERELGVVLLNRTKQGISLTEEGEYLFNFLSNLRGPWETMRTEIRNLNQVDKLIKIGLPQFLFSDATLVCIMHLSDDIPGCSILVEDIPTETCWDNISNGVIDIAVTLNNPFDLQLVCSPAIASIRSAYLCVSTLSKFANKETICMKDLAHSTIISVEASTMPANRLEQYCKDAKANLRIIPRSHTLIEAIIARGEGCFIAPGSASLYFEDENITAIPIIDFPRVFHQHVVHSKFVDDNTLKVAEDLKNLLEKPTRQILP